MILLGFPNCLSKNPTPQPCHTHTGRGAVFSVLASPWLTGCSAAMARRQQAGRLQNLNRSMKCCGDTGMKQLSGSAAVQGCPESFQKRMLQCRQKCRVSPYCSLGG